MALGLARAHVASLASLPEEDEDRLSASNMLTQALREMGEYTEALSLGVTTLCTWYISAIGGPSTPVGGSGGKK